jgi:protein TonB
MKPPVTRKFENAEPVNATHAETATRTSPEKTTDSTLAGSTSTPAADSAHLSGHNTDASALQAWLAAIKARIERAKRYPMMAERRRIQGEAVVSFRISFDGLLLEDPKLIKSSGFSLLDKAALRAVKRAAPFPRFPGPREEMFTGPLSVELDFVIR